MEKDEYLKYRRDDTKEFTPVLHFYYLLKGGMIGDEGMFMKQYTRWVLAKSLGFFEDFKRNLARVNQMVIKELDEYFSINT